MQKKVHVKVQASESARTVTLWIVLQPITSQKKEGLKRTNE